MHDVRPAAVAGMFYPDAPSRLAADVRGYLARVAAASGRWPKAVIVPHAGYVYSGSVAAAAFARLAPMRGAVTRVVLLGPTHRVAVRGLAVSTARAFATPLGAVAVDADAVALALALPQVVASDPAHALEHSLEVELPFLQTVLDEFALVPFAVGQASPKEVATVLDALWGGPETLIVVSSDLSHYHRYDEARALDRRTADAILALEPNLDHEQACGATPVNGLLLCARRRGLAPSLLDLRNSGDTAGDKSRVVGYGSFVFCDHAQRHTDLGAALLTHARAAIGEALRVSVPVPGGHSALAAPGATFVTLRSGGELRGCIGSIEAWRPLGVDVRANAVAAAIRDPRFEPLAAAEYDEIAVEVSLLDRSEPLSAANEAEALSQLRPNVDGLILECGRRRATFLPQVWEQLPEPREFLAALKHKAGLPSEFWSADVVLSRYSVAKFTEARGARERRIDASAAAAIVAGHAGSTGMVVLE